MFNPQSNQSFHEEGIYHHLNEYIGPINYFPDLVQPLHCHFRNVFWHAVIDGTSGKDHLRVMADFLCFLHKVIGVDRDASRPPTSPGRYRWKFHLVPAVLKPRPCQARAGQRSRESSFISAMLRSRWTFSITRGSLGGFDIRGLVDVGHEPVQLRQCVQCLLVHAGNKNISGGKGGLPPRGFGI